MAKKICCICGKEVSKFEFAGHPDSKHEDLWFCESCLNRRKQLLNIENQELSADAATFFQARAVACQEPAVKDYIGSLLAARDALIATPTDMDVREKIENRLTGFPMTTGFSFDGFHITEYKRVVSAEAVLGTGFLSEFTAGFADFFGVESQRFAAKLEEARLAAEVKLVERAESIGANALIGIIFNYTQFAGNIIGVIVSGTAVIREKAQ